MNSKKKTLRVFVISILNFRGKAHHFYCLRLRFYCSIVKSYPEYAYKGYIYKRNMYFSGNNA